MFFRMDDPVPFELTRESVAMAKRNAERLEAALAEKSLREAQAATVPHSEVGSETEDPAPMTREPTGLAPDVLKEMGVILYPRWQD